MIRMRANRPTTLAGWMSAAVAAAAIAGVSPSATQAASPPTSRTCPSASIVNAALGEKGTSPTSSTTPYSKTCTYPHTGIVATRITFQVDTSATFAAGENAAARVAPIVKIHGLGQAAWAPKVPGSLYVFNKGTTIKILALLVPTAKLEALARKLL